MSYITGRKQVSPICIVEEGDYNDNCIVVKDGVSPMTYKKLKEKGYTSDDWSNWSDDEKVQKSQEGKETEKPSEKAASKQQTSSDVEKTLSSKASKLSHQIEQLKRERKEVNEKYNYDHKNPEVAKLDKKWEELTSQYYSTADALRNIRRNKESSTPEENVEELTAKSGRESIKTAYESLRNALKMVRAGSEEQAIIEDAQNALLDARGGIKGFEDDDELGDLSETYSALIDARGAIADMGQPSNSKLREALTISKQAVDKLIKQIEQYSR